jgi:hypothetical protein
MPDLGGSRLVGYTGQIAHRCSPLIDYSDACTYRGVAGDKQQEKVNIGRHALATNYLHLHSHYRDYRDYIT